MSITHYSNGRKVTNSSHADALIALREEFPDMVIAHDEGERPRTLVWPNEQSAANDDGAHAVAEITLIP